jgi:hypothetical protein
VRAFAGRHKVAFWLLLVGVLVALYVVLFIAGQGGVSGGSS